MTRREQSSLKKSLAKRPDHSWRGVGQRSSDWAHIGSRGHVFEHQSIKDPFLTIPGHDAVKPRIAQKWKAKKSRKTASSKTAPTSPSTSALDALPVEPLLRILELLIPTRRIFHFTTCDQKSPRFRTMAVHQICEAFPNNPTCSITDMALCGRTLKAVAYSLLYGRNQFVLEVAQVPHRSQIRLARNVDKVSRNKLVRVKENAPILYGDVLRYVKDLTISIGLTSRNGTLLEREQIRERLQQLADSLTGQDYALKKLTISTAKLQQVEKHWTSVHLQISREVTKGMIVRMSFRAVTAGTDSKQCIPQPNSAMDNVVLPLTTLENVECEVTHLNSDKIRLQESEMRGCIADCTGCVSRRKDE